MQETLLQHEENSNQIKLFSMASITVVLLGCVGMIEYSLVMPSMSTYVHKLGGSDFFYGASMAAFSACRVLFMPLLGWWSDRRPMIEPFLFSIILSIIGNILYGLAEWANSKWFVLCGRAIVGMGAANATLSMSYMTRITTHRNRTKALATLNGINLLGIVFGPATNLCINWTLNTGIDGLQLNPYTNPGFAMVFVLTLIMVAMIATFREPPNMCAPSAQVANESTDAPVGKTWSDIYWKLFWGKSLWVHFVVSFVSNFILSELECALPDMTTYSYGWTPLQNSLMYSVVGIVTALTLVFTAILSKKWSDRSFVRLGTVLYGASLVMGCVKLRDPALPFNYFCMSILLLIIASPITDSPNLSCYSKRLQACDEAIPYMGMFIGFIQASNSVSRTVAPLYAGYALRFKETSYLLVLAGPLGAVVFTMFVLVWKYHTMAESYVPSSEPQRLTRHSSVMDVLESPTILMSSPMIAATPLVLRSSGYSSLIMEDS